MPERFPKRPSLRTHTALAPNLREPIDPTFPDVEVRSIARPTPVVDTRNAVERGIESGGRQLGSAALNLRAAARASTGVDENNIEGIQSDLARAQHLDEQAQEFGPKVRSIFDVHNVSDLGEYLGGGIGEQAVIMGAPTVAGVLGGLVTGGPGGAVVGGIAGTTRGLGAVSGLAAKHAKKETLKSVKKFVKNKLRDAQNVNLTPEARRAAMEEVSDKLRGAGDRTARKVLANLEGKKQLLNMTGLQAGAFGTAGGIEAGSNFGELAADEESTASLEERARTSLVFGTFQGMLEGLPQIKLLKRMGIANPAKEITEHAGKSFGRHGLEQAVMEATTEAGQEFLSVAAHNYINDNIEFFSEDQIKRYVDSAVLGGILGGGTGLLAGGVGNAKDRLLSRLEKHASGEQDLNDQVKQAALAGKSNRLEGPVSDKKGLPAPATKPTPSPKPDRVVVDSKGGAKPLTEKQAEQARRRSVEIVDSKGRPQVEKPLTDKQAEQTKKTSKPLTDKQAKSSELDSLASSIAAAKNESQAGDLKRKAIGIINKLPKEQRAEAKAAFDAKVEGVSGLKEAVQTEDRAAVVRKALKNPELAELKARRAKLKRRLQPSSKASAETKKKAAEELKKVEDEMIEKSIASARKQVAEETKNLSIEEIANKFIDPKGDLESSAGVTENPKIRQIRTLIANHGRAKGKAKRRLETQIREAYSELESAKIDLAEVAREGGRQGGGKEGSTAPSFTKAVRKAFVAGLPVDSIQKIVGGTKGSVLAELTAQQRASIQQKVTKDEAIADSILEEKEEAKDKKVTIAFQKALRDKAIRQRQVAADEELDREAGFNTSDEADAKEAQVKAFGYNEIESDDGPVPVPAKDGTPRIAIARSATQASDKETSLEKAARRWNEPFALRTGITRELMPLKDWLKLVLDKHPSNRNGAELAILGQATRRDIHAERMQQNTLLGSEAKIVGQRNLAPSDTSTAPDTRSTIGKAPKSPQLDLFPETTKDFVPPPKDGNAPIVPEKVAVRIRRAAGVSRAVSLNDLQILVEVRDPNVDHSGDLLSVEDLEAIQPKRIPRKSGKGSDPEPTLASNPHSNITHDNAATQSVTASTFSFSPYRLAKAALKQIKAQNPSVLEGMSRMQEIQYALMEGVGDLLAQGIIDRYPDFPPGIVVGFDGSAEPKTPLHIDAEQKLAAEKDKDKRIELETTIKEEIKKVKNLGIGPLPVTYAMIDHVSLTRMLKERVDAIGKYQVAKFKNAIYVATKIVTESKTRGPRTESSENMLKALGVDPKKVEMDHANETIKNPRDFADAYALYVGFTHPRVQKFEAVLRDANKRLENARKISISKRATEAQKAKAKVDIEKIGIWAKKLGLPIKNIQTLQVVKGGKLKLSAYRHPLLRFVNEAAVNKNLNLFLSRQNSADLAVIEENRQRLAIDEGRKLREAEDIMGYIEEVTGINNIVPAGPAPQGVEFTGRSVPKGFAPDRPTSESSKPSTTPAGHVAPSTFTADALRTRQATGGVREDGTARKLVTEFSAALNKLFPQRDPNERAFTAPTASRPDTTQADLLAVFRIALFLNNNKINPKTKDVPVLTPAERKLINDEENPDPIKAYANARARLMDKLRSYIHDLRDANDYASQEKRYENESVAFESGQPQNKLEKGGSATASFESTMEKERNQLRNLDRWDVEGLKFLSEKKGRVDLSAPVTPKVRRAWDSIMRDIPAVEDGTLAEDTYKAKLKSGRAIMRRVQAAEAELEIQGRLVAMNKGFPFSNWTELKKEALKNGLDKLVARRERATKAQAFQTYRTEEVESVSPAILGRREKNLQALINLIKRRNLSKLASFDDFKAFIVGEMKLVSSGAAIPESIKTMGQLIDYTARLRALTERRVHDIYYRHSQDPTRALDEFRPEKTPVDSAVEGNLYVEVANKRGEEVTRVDAIDGLEFGSRGDIYGSVDPARVQEIKDYIEKTTTASFNPYYPAEGEDFGVPIYGVDASGNQVLRKRVAGVYTPIDKIIRVAANIVAPFHMDVASHEAMHAVYEELLLASERRVLSTYFAQDKIERRIIAYFEKIGYSPEMIEDMKIAMDPATNPKWWLEERISNGFQAFYRSEQNFPSQQFQIIDEPKGIFRKLLTKLKHIFGILNRDEKVQTLFDHIHKGNVKVARQHNRRLKLTHPDAKFRTPETLSDMASSFYQWGGDFVRNYIMPSDIAMRRVGIDAFRKLADLGYKSSLYATAENNENTFVEQFKQQNITKLTLFHKWWVQLSPDRRGDLFTALYSRIDPEKIENATTKRDVDNFRRFMNEDMYSYVRSRGADMGFVDKSYAPLVFDKSRLAEKEVQFKADIQKLIDEGLKEKNESIAALEKTIKDKGIKETKANQMRRNRHKGKLERRMDKIAEYGGANAIYTNLVTAADIFHAEVNIGTKEKFARPRDYDFLNEMDVTPYVSKDFEHIMFSYITQMTRHAEFEHFYGKDGKDAKALIEQAIKQGATPKEIESAKNYILALKGSLGADINPQLLNTFSWITTYQNVRTLGLALITSLVDVLGIAVSTGDLSITFNAMRQSAKEVSNFYANRKEVKQIRSRERELRSKLTLSQWEQDEFAGLQRRKEQMKTDIKKLGERIGTIDGSGIMSDALTEMFATQDMTTTPKQINEFFFKYINGLDMWTNLTRTMATHAGDAFIKQNLDMVNAASLDSSTGDISSKGGVRAKRFLNELGIDDFDDIVRDEDGNILYDADAIKVAKPMFDDAEALRRSKVAKDAIWRFVDRSVLRPNAAQRPIAASDPHFMLLYHLKSFVFSFQTQIINRAAREVKHGNPIPLLYLSMFVPAMLAADLLRWTIQYPIDGPDWDDDWTWMDYMQRATQRSGVLGMAEPFVQAHANTTRFGGSGIEALVGPAPQQAIEIGRTLLTGSPSFYEQTVNALPLNNVYRNWFGD